MSICSDGSPPNPETLRHSLPGEFGFDHEFTTNTTQFSFDFYTRLTYFFNTIVLCCTALNVFHMQLFVMWLDAVTYLHHHGHDDKLPWYRGEVCQSNILECLVWNFLERQTIEWCVWHQFINFSGSAFDDQTGMELPKRRINHSRSRLWMDQQHPSWHWNSCHSPSLPSDPTLSLNRSSEYPSQPCI